MIPVRGLVMSTLIILLKKQT